MNQVSNHDRKRLVGFLRGASDLTEGILIPIVLGERLTIGRFENCTLRIDLPGIEEIHAHIYTDATMEFGGSVYLYVHKSIVYLNNRPIKPKSSVMLFSGCMFYFAHSEVQFYYTSMTAATYPFQKSLLEEPMDHIQFLKKCNPPVKLDNNYVNDLKWNVVRLPDIIGHGKTSSVYLSVPYAVPQGIPIFQFACKVITIQPIAESRGLAFMRSPNRSFKARFDIEVEILKAARHPCIPYFIGQYVVDEMNGCNRYLHLFTPLACGGTLQTLIDKKIKYPASDNLSKEKIRFIFYQLLHGVHHLHRLYTNSAKKLYIHGDIKPENILVMNDTDRPYIVISDFGHALSIKIENKLNLNQKIYPQFFKNEGTLAYFSPERCDPHHEWTIGDHLYVDIWALGVTLYQLITLEHPFVPLNNDLEEGDESHLIIQNIQNIKLRFNQPCWKKEYDITHINFIKSILTKTNRPSIPQLLFHSFMVKSKNDINLARMQRRWDDYSVDEAFYSNNNNKLQEIYNDDVDMNLISDETFEKIQTAFENNTAIKFTLPDNILRRSYYEHDYNSISEIIERPESKSVRPLEFLDGLTLDPDEQILLEKASIMKE